MGHPIEVLYRDPHLLVVDKPSGLPTTSPQGGGPSLTELVGALDPDAPRLHPSSRLDAEVTGVVTFARTRRATKALLSARKRGAYERVYWAVSSGIPEPAAGSWTGVIDLDQQDPRRRVWAPEGSGSARARPAHTDYRVLQVLGDLAQLELRPRTGRTHQLRVHAAAFGVPLLGDRHYGGPTRITQRDGRVVRAARVMLHCARVTVPDPDGSGMRAFTSPMPSDMAELVARLGGSAA